MYKEIEVYDRVLDFGKKGIVQYAPTRVWVYVTARSIKEGTRN